MTCTLFFIAGEFLDTLSDQTHIQIRGEVEQLKKLRENAAYKPHDILMLNQAINLFEPPPPDTSPAPEPQLSKYQAYLQHLFMKADQNPHFCTKVKKVFEKMRLQAGTGVDFTFLLTLVLDLQSYNLNQYQPIARFVTELSRSSYPEFGLLVCDVLLERVRRGIERDGIAFHQRQLCEVRFVAELCAAELMPLKVVFDTCQLILSLGYQSPTMFLIKVEGPRAPRITVKPADWFRVELVCCLLDTVCPALVHGQPVVDIAQVQHVLVWLQLFCLIRAPIPSSVAFRVDELLTLYDREKIEGTIRLDTKELMKDFTGKGAQRQEYKSPYTAVPAKPPPLQIVRATKPVKKPTEEEEYDSDPEGDDSEKHFLRELAEFKEELEQEKQATNRKKIATPMFELLKTDGGQRPSLRMTPNGPPPEFQVVIPKGNKSETIAFVLPPQPPQSPQ
jgi:hypothetical protein